MTDFLENWDYFLPVNIVFGRGRTAEIGEKARKFGKKALVVTGKNSAKKSGLLDKITRNLLAAGIESTVFSDVEPNPLTTTAQKGAQKAKEAECDMVVAAGGGSIIDAAKGIAFAAKNAGSLSDYIFARKSSDDALPVIAVPTTCGTGSEGNGFAVLTNPATGDKKSLRCPAIIPKLSIVDSENMQTMPQKVLRSVGFDALCHCIEAYTANNARPLSSALCIYAIRLINDTLPYLCRGGDSEKAWDAMALASLIGGMAIGVSGVTLAHGMEHPASGLKNIVHGEGLAALTPAVLDFYAQSLEIDAPAAQELADISRILGGKGVFDCAERVQNLILELGLPQNLSTLGIAESDIDWLTENCLKVSAGNLSNTPVFAGEAEIRELYRRAL